MAILGKAQGVFELKNSDMAVGSFLSKEDIKNFLGVSDNDLSALKFKDIDGVQAVDERKVQKAWYSGQIANAPPVESSSLDEILLLAIVHNTLPGCVIERQIKVNRFKMDLKISYKGKSLFIEFDGPSHFAISRYGPPKNEPFRKKKIVEDATGIEVVNWAYWIQRCKSNVKALFDTTIKGYGVLWSTNVHFGDFYFDNSSEIIEAINNRFKADHDGYGYFYGPNTLGRNNPEHPIVEKIISGAEPIGRLLPKGFKDKGRWLPEKLQNIT
ncbi:MAG: hypothetical protein K9N34_10810 [Candidatus Marinimicrobia bacterium]|nr:hypothetical protein [Candidatus Neomarinimicrobiota bacterium]